MKTTLWTIRLFASIALILQYGSPQGLADAREAHGNMSTSASVPALSSAQRNARSPALEASCRTVRGLTRAQRAACARAPAAAHAALAGLRAAVRECRHQLRWHRWNCSELDARAQNPHESNLLKRGYRESAFVYALASAGVAHSVAKSCAQGQLISCGCDPAGYRSSVFMAEGSPIAASYPHSASTVRSRAAARWKWGGCSHNLDYGISFSKAFLDSRERAGDIQSQVNLHNNEAGRLALATNMEVRCKCHGMSGSCQLKTCWRAAPDFRVVGTALKERFRSAVMVEQSGLNRGSPTLKGRRRGRRRGRARRAPAPSLLYYERSPSFCERDMSSDIEGTAGRSCKRGPSAAGSCGSLCCGRGHDLVRRRREQRCNCRFQWCCAVHCERCIVDDWVAVCK